jgi:hypothetical protein
MSVRSAADSNIVISMTEHGKAKEAARSAPLKSKKAMNETEKMVTGNG